MSGLVRMVLQDAQTRLVFKAKRVKQLVPSSGTEDVDPLVVLESARGESEDCFLLVHVAVADSSRFHRSLILFRALRLARNGSESEGERHPVDQVGPKPDFPAFGKDEGSVYPV